jgi:hypothetical protein
MVQPESSRREPTLSVTCTHRTSYRPLDHQFEIGRVSTRLATSELRPHHSPVVAATGCASGRPRNAHRSMQVSGPAGSNRPPACPSRTGTACLNVHPIPYINTGAAQRRSYRCRGIASYRLAAAQYNQGRVLTPNAGVSESVRREQHPVPLGLGTMRTSGWVAGGGRPVFPLLRRVVRV